MRGTMIMKLMINVFGIFELRDSVRPIIESFLAQALAKLKLQLRINLDSVV